MSNSLSFEKNTCNGAKWPWCTSMVSFANVAMAGRKRSGSCRFFMATPRKMAWQPSSGGFNTPFENRQSNWSNTQKQATKIALRHSHSVGNTLQATLRKWLILSCDCQLREGQGSAEVQPERRGAQSRNDERPFSKDRSLPFRFWLMR